MLTGSLSSNGWTDPPLRSASAFLVLPAGSQTVQKIPALLLSLLVVWQGGADAALGPTGGARLVWLSGATGGFWCFLMPSGLVGVQSCLFLAFKSPFIAAPDIVNLLKRSES